MKSRNLSVGIWDGGVFMELGIERAEFSPQEANRIGIALIECATRAINAERERATSGDRKALERDSANLRTAPGRKGPKRVGSPKHPGNQQN